MGQRPPPISMINKVTEADILSAALDIADTFKVQELFSKRRAARVFPIGLYIANNCIQLGGVGVLCNRGCRDVASPRLSPWRGSKIWITTHACGDGAFGCVVPTRVVVITAS